jgi:hypothetical protein
MFKPRRNRRHHWEKWQQWHKTNGHYRRHYYCHSTEQSTNEDTIESTTVMAGIKKKILSKNFKGGEITNVFGGTEIDFTQADFEGKVTIELTNAFGGTRLIIPANWEIISEFTSVLGGIDDKRPQHPKTEEEKKVLVLRGTNVFGGVEIKS